MRNIHASSHALENVCGTSKNVDNIPMRRKLEFHVILHSEED